MALSWNCFKGGCQDLRQEEKWIEINGPGSEGKQNKPAEQLYELKKICNECNRVVVKAYFTKEQVDDLDRKRNAEIQRAVGESGEAGVPDGSIQQAEP